MRIIHATSTRQHEAGETVEELVRRGMEAAQDAGVSISHTKMVKTIRKAHRVNGAGFAQAAIDYLIQAKSWAAFELFVNCYADPTGAEAARRLDLEDAARLIRARRRVVTTNG